MLRPLPRPVDEAELRHAFAIFSQLDAIAHRLNTRVHGAARRKRGGGDVDSRRDPCSS